VVGASLASHHAHTPGGRLLFYVPAVGFLILVVACAPLTASELDDLAKRRGSRRAMAAT
jgi:hypothetical protein